MNSNKKSHQQNVDNLEVLTTQVATFQPVFNPSETRLAISNQVQLKRNGDEVLIGVMVAESACDNAVAARTKAFDGLESLVTRVINGLRISDVTEQTINQCESIVRELRNKRASEIVPPAEPVEGTETEEPARHNKMRSGSYNTKIENFTKLMILLSTLPTYKPNETDITIASLGVKLETLKLSNTGCINAEAAADAARMQRQIVLYANKTGLVDIGTDVKLYIKSAYGASSPQYKSIRGLSFTKLK